MNHPRIASLKKLLQALQAASIEFIVVGGTAAALHGSGTTTLDLDIVPSQTSDNLDRLEQLLLMLDACSRADMAERQLRPSRTHLEGSGQLLLSTALGPLDLHLRLHDGRGYAELIHLTEVLHDGEARLTVIQLEALIEIKRQAARHKDALVLPSLIALLEKRVGG